MATAAAAVGATAAAVGGGVGRAVAAATAATAAAARAAAAAVAVMAAAATAVAGPGGGGIGGGASGGGGGAGRRRELVAADARRVDRVALDGAAEAVLANHPVLRGDLHGEGVVPLLEHLDVLVARRRRERERHARKVDDDLPVAFPKPAVGGRVDEDLKVEAARPEVGALAGVPLVEVDAERAVALGGPHALAERAGGSGGGGWRM